MADNYQSTYVHQHLAQVTVYATPNNAIQSQNTTPILAYDEIQRCRPLYRTSAALRCLAPMAPTTLAPAQANRLRQAGLAWRLH